MQTFYRFSKFYALLFSFTCFGLSYYYGQFYINGDQGHYIEFYENLSNFSLVEGYFKYFNALGAREPVYYIIVFFFNSLIPKLLLFSIFNFFLSFFIALGLLRLGMHPVILLLLIPNFYLHVLFLAAERLKVSMTFLAVGLTFNVYKNQLVFIFLSILSHFQAILFFTSVFAKKISNIITPIFKTSRINTKSFLTILFTIILLSAVIYIYKDTLLDKAFDRNKEDGGIKSVFKPLIFFIFSLIYTKNKKFELALSFLPLIMLAFLIGEFRITIFCYFIFMFYGVQYRGGLNLGVILSSTYFLFKGIFFLKEVFDYGTGLFGN